MDAIQKVLIKAGRKDLAQQYFKKAKIGDGPIGVVLINYWNKIHDFEDDLENALKDYDMAISYSGKPGEKSADKVYEEGMKVINELKHISTKSLANLFTAEDDFVKKFGHPVEYSKEQRNKMFKN